MTIQQRQQRQAGAVSLFVVIFATLLMIIITLSFVQLMIKDQRQATASDLSQSAYDSAQAGVEDAKRLLLLKQACDGNAASASVNCSAVTDAIASGKCNTVSKGLSNGLNISGEETMIEQDEGDDKLQQAYTCVKINATPPDYRSDVDMNHSDIFPLKGVGVFDQVRISWFTARDLPTSDLTIGFYGSGSSVELPRVPEWGANNPPLLRAQLMQAGGNFTLADYDSEKNASTVFLYPSKIDSSASFVSVRRDGLQKPALVKCKATLSNTDTHACSVTLNIPAPADGNTANRNAFLRLSALYNAAHYKVELLEAGNVVPFDNVQPEVDSTGRANDMFRRVKSRVELRGDFTYPEAAIDIAGDLCKNFTIINRDPDPALGENFGYTTACTP